MKFVFALAIIVALVCSITQATLINSRLSSLIPGLNMEESEQLIEILQNNKGSALNIPGLTDDLLSTEGSNGEAFLLAMERPKPQGELTLVCFCFD
jgi:hypothetical protein